MLSLGYMCPLYVVDVGLSLLPNKEQLVQTSPPMRLSPQIRQIPHSFSSSTTDSLETVPYVDGLMDHRSKWNLRRFCWKYLTGVNYWDEVVVFYLAWFTWLSIKWIAASENVQRHSAFLNEAIPSFKPFMYFPNAGSPGYIFFVGKICMSEKNFYFRAHLKVLYSLYVF